MANEYDGSIKLAATFDVSYIKKSAEEVRKEMDKAFDATSTMKVTKEVDNLRQSLRKVSQEYDAAKNKAEELENTVNFTEGYEKLIDDLTDLKGAYSANILELERLARKGITSGQEYNQILGSINAQQREMFRIESQMQKMRENNQAYISGTQTKEYAEAVRKMDDAASRMRILKTRTDEMAVSQLKSSTGWKVLGTTFGVLGKDIKSLVGKLKQLAVQLLKTVSSTVVNGFKNLGSAIFGLGRNAESSSFSFSKLLKTLFAYGIGIGTLTTLFNKLRAGIAAGLENLANMDGGLNNVRATLNEFTTSLDYVKNSLAAAFYPIIQVVQPILTGFMDMLAQTIQRIGALVSALTGATSYIKAVRTPSKSKAEQSADKAAAKAQTQADKKAAKDQYNAEKAAYKQQVNAQKEAIKQQNANKAATQKVNSLVGKNTTRTNSNTKSKNKNTKATEKNANALKKQQNVLAGFDDLDILQQEEEEDTVLDSLADTPADIAQPLQNAANAVSPNATANIKDFDGALADVAETLPEVAEAFEEADIPGWIQELADAIKGFIEAGDWFGLGQFLGEKLNGFLQVVDDWINNTLRPMGVQWAQNIAELLNGLVAGIDWELLGKTLADGINAIFDIINTFLTTFDFLKFGQSIGAAIKSWFDNIEWDLIGQTFANYWNALFHTIEGIVTTEGIWTSIGTSIGTFLKNAIQELDIDSIATIFIAVFNGVFEMLRAFMDQNPFEGFAEKIYNALNRMIHEINWEQAGKTLSEFVVTLLSVFVEVAENTDWEGFGRGIGEFLSNVDWADILGKVATIIWEVVSGLIKGLLSTDGGKVFLAIVAGIEGLKIAFALGANLLLPAIEKVLIEKLAQLLVTGGFKSIFVAAAGAVKTALTAALGFITGMGPGIVTAISTLLTTITTVIQTALTFLFSPTGILIMVIAGALILLGKLIYDHWDEICDFLGKAWDWLVEFFNQLPEFIESILKAVANILIFMINWQIAKVELFANVIITIINGIIEAINTFLSPVNSLIGSLSGGSIDITIPTIPKVNAPRIPYLAQGAVIPPNRQFLAMLGDQTSGTNIEAPLDTIVDAFRQVVGNMNVQNTGYSEMVLDGQVFARLATPYIISELGRQGYDVKVLEGT